MQIHNLFALVFFIRACSGERVEPPPLAPVDWRSLGDRPVFARVDAENQTMAWGLPGVTNWYKSESGRVSQNWPFPLAEYWRLTRAPNPDDFVFQPLAAEAPA